jgi:hypothetical protein
MAIINTLILLIIISTGTSFADQAQDTLSSLANIGFPFAKVINGSDELTIEKGPLFYFGGFKNTDSLETDSLVFLKLSGLKMDQPWNDQAIKSSIKNLSSSLYFKGLKNTKSLRLFKHSTRQILYIDPQLQKIKNNFIEGSFGYDNNDHAINGFLGIQLFNILGTARNFTFAFDTDAQQSKLHSTYLEPWLFNSDFDLITNLSHFQDSLNQEQSLALEIKRSQINYFKPLLGIQYSYSRYQESTPKDWRSFYVGFDLGFPIAYYKDVFQIHIQHKTAVIDLEEYHNNHQTKTDLFLKLYNRLGHELKHHFFLTWPYLSNTPSLTSSIGGHQNLRGFKPNIFISNWSNYFSNEFLFLINPKWTPGLFYDQVLFEDLQFKRKYFSSIGLSFTIKTPNNNWDIYLSVARGLQKEHKQTWLHLKLKHYF